MAFADGRSRWVRSARRASVGNVARGIGDGIEATARALHAYLRTAKRSCRRTSTSRVHFLVASNQRLLLSW